MILLHSPSVNVDCCQRLPKKIFKFELSLYVELHLK